MDADSLLSFLWYRGFIDKDKIDKAESISRQKIEVFLGRLRTQSDKADIYIGRMNMNGIERITAERKRQIQDEGWTAIHDEQHTSGELLLLAACYILKNYTFADLADRIGKELATYWGDEGWIKYTDPIRNLEKASALCAAEIDRLSNLYNSPDAENHSK